MICPHTSKRFLKSKAPKVCGTNFVPAMYFRKDHFQIKCILFFKIRDYRSKKFELAATSGVVSKKSIFVCLGNGSIRCHLATCGGSSQVWTISAYTPETRSYTVAESSSNTLKKNIRFSSRSTKLSEQRKLKN